MKFTKMQGAGNHFIVINNMIEQIPEDRWSELARTLCRRRLSLGADGLMIVEKARQGGDFRMVFYNSDGSVGEMCGNGARCISRYGYEYGLSDENVCVETKAGNVYGRRLSETEYEVRLNDPTVAEAHRIVEIDGCSYDCGYMELGCPGIPHAVLELEDWDRWSRERLFALGRALRSADTFPKGANVTFCRKLEEDRFAVRTFERGVEDFTLACGTGCGSTASVLMMRGLSSGRNVRLETDGGTLTVSLSVTEGVMHDLLLRGPTCIVAEGEIKEVWQ